jgi:hypothetical protein
MASAFVASLISIRLGVSVVLIEILLGVVGKIKLHALEYPFETTAANISSLPLPNKIKAELTAVLRTSTVPGRAS